MKTYTLHCKYCGFEFTVTCKPDELSSYLRCCTVCWENDEPGMARFNKQAELMGTSWAIAHNSPIRS